MTGSVEVEIVDQVATITICNEAKRNSLDLPMLAQLTDIASAIGRDEAVKLVILRGEGSKAFSAGADFDAIAAPPFEESAARMDAALVAAATALKAMEVPLIAAISGACFGGALQLAFTADIRIASADSKFGVPAVQIGLAYPLDGIADFVRIAGAGNAALTFLTGLNFDAAEALQRGFVEVVSPIETFDDELARLVAGMGKSGRPALVAYKAMIRALALQDAKAAGAHHQAFADTKAFVPALAAVIEKRRAKGAPA